MIEEEKAEQYANKKAIENNMPADSEVIQYMTKAYLAGLHEGQPKWHDLRKDPNDLPKENGISCLGVLEYMRGERKIEWVYFFTEYKWLDNEYSKCGDLVIAWCEIPQFKE